MKYTVNDGVYDGSPQEIAELIKLQQDMEPKDEDVKEDGFDQGDFAPIENAVNESAELRKKLAEDPNYSPFGGVVPPKDSNPDEPASPAISADLDTGVELKS